MGLAPILLCNTGSGMFVDDWFGGGGGGGVNKVQLHGIPFFIFL
jgi:hypothetical protein